MTVSWANFVQKLCPTLSKIITFRCLLFYRAVKQSVPEVLQSYQPSVVYHAALWAPAGPTLTNEFSTDGFISCTVSPSSRLLCLISWLRCHFLFLLQTPFNDEDGPYATIVLLFKVPLEYMRHLVIFPIRTHHFAGVYVNYLLRLK